MRGRQARDIGERVESDCLAKMHVDIFVNSSQNPWRKPNTKAQDRRINPPSWKGSDRCQLARLDCECPNCQLLPITQRHDPYLSWEKQFVLHSPIELSAVDLNQKSRWHPLFDCHIGTRQERGIVKPGALAILMLTTALGHAAQIRRRLTSEEYQGDVPVILRLITQGKELPTSTAVRDLVNALRV
jgi:hypothetical protein